MKVTMIKAFAGYIPGGFPATYPAGHICDVNRDAGKWLISNGYAVENTSGTSNQDRFVQESRPPEQPQVIVMPYPVELPGEEEE